MNSRKKNSRAPLISLTEKQRYVISPHTIRRPIKEKAYGTNRFSRAKEGVFNVKVIKKAKTLAKRCGFFSFWGQYGALNLLIK